MTERQPNPEEVLREEILADARRQAERTVGRAGRDADALLEQARREADKDREQRLAASGRQAQRRRDVVMATVPVEAARMRAERTEAALDAVRDEVRRRLLKREGCDYRETVVRLAVEAILRMTGERFVLEVPESDLRSWGDRLVKEVRRRIGRDGLEISVASEPARIEAGVLIRDAERRQVWDNSLEARLERLWPAMRPEVGAGLLRDPAGESGKES